MGGELVVQPPEKDEHSSLTEIFWEAYPAYIQMGMPSEEYWHGDAQACVAYRKAYAERLKMEDHMAWRTGVYVYHALCCVAPYFNTLKPKPPEKYIQPFGFEPEKPKDEDRPDKAIEFMKAWAESVNAQRAKKNGSS